MIAAINGHALGGGLELTLCLRPPHLRAGAKLGMPPAKLGLIYGHTGLQRFIDAIGVPRTKELFLTGRNLPADRAEEIGLVNQVVDDAALESAAVELAAEVAANAPLSMRGNKQAIDTLNSYPPPDARAGARADRATGVVLRLRGLPRGRSRRSPRSASRSGRADDRFLIGVRPEIRPVNASSRTQGEALWWLPKASRRTPGRCAAPGGSAGSLRGLAIGHRY